jgi:dTDP-glucose 4,6-dehydratase
VNIDYIVNFAAESHVDNSIIANKVFLESNVYGVYNLLELVRAK